MNLHISDGNMKLGKIPNISIIPGNDCGNASHCVATCYARKAYKSYPSTKTAWDENSAMFWTAEQTGDWSPILDPLRAYLTKKNPVYFRWHVAGDFISQAHVDHAFLLAKEFDHIKFLAFTKMDTLDFSMAPPNFSVVASMWPGMPDRFPASMPRAWMDDGTDPRIPEQVVECPNGCDTCGACWNLGTIGKDVRFHKH